MSSLISHLNPFKLWNSGAIDQLPGVRCEVWDGIFPRWSDLRWRLVSSAREERESLIVTVTAPVTFPISHLTQNKNYTEFLITESCWDLCVIWTVIICQENFELIRLQTKRLKLRIISNTNHWLITDQWSVIIWKCIRVSEGQKRPVFGLISLSCPSLVSWGPDTTPVSWGRDTGRTSLSFINEELAFINQTTATTASNLWADLLCIPAPYSDNQKNN